MYPSNQHSIETLLKTPIGDVPPSHWVRAASLVATTMEWSRDGPLQSLGCRGHQGRRATSSFICRKKMHGWVSRPSGKCSGKRP